MKPLRRLLGLLMLVVVAAHVTAHVAHAAEVRPFDSASLDAIRAAHARRPFILIFWSIDCAHCPKELKALGELKRQYPKLDIVLVSTDNEAEAAQLAGFAAQQGLGAVEQWMFADPQPEKLRFAVDRRWWGELPRTYFFDASHRSEGVSGLVAPERLQRWAGEHGR